MSTREPVVVAVTNYGTIGGEHFVGDVEFSDGLVRRCMRHRPAHIRDSPLRYEWWALAPTPRPPRWKEHRAAMPAKRIDALDDVLAPLLEHARALASARENLRAAKTAYLAALGDCVEALNGSGRRMVDRANEWVRILTAQASRRTPAADEIAQVAKEIAAVRSSAGDADAALHRAEQHVAACEVEVEALTPAIPLKSARETAGVEAVAT